MATKKKAVTRKARGADKGWEDELAKAAEQSRGQAAASAPKGSGAMRVGIAGGVLTLGGKEVKGNSMEVVILDFLRENAFYPDAYDPSNPVPPSCYAIGREEDDLEPSAKAEEPEADACDGCPQNEWGSADTGRGKACKNSYRMALWVPDADEEGEPPTVVTLTAKLTVFKELSEYLDSCANDLRRPYWAVLTTLSTGPDRRSQFKLTFQAVETLSKAETKVVQDLRSKRTEELLYAEFPTRASVEASRQARRDAEGSKKRQGKLTGKKKAAAKKKASSRRAGR